MRRVLGLIVAVALVGALAPAPGATANHGDCRGDEVPAGAVIVTVYTDDCTGVIVDENTGLECKDQPNGPVHVFVGPDCTTGATFGG